MTLSFTPSIYHIGSGSFDGQDPIIAKPPIKDKMWRPPYLQVPITATPIIKGPDKGPVDLELSPTNKYQGFVWDDILFKKHGASSRVDGAVNGEITTFGGTENAPDAIIYTDRSTGKEHKYTYRKITQEEIDAGKLSTGEKISKEQFKPGETYYVLISVEGAKKSNHVEIYKLYINKESGTCHLYQGEGMDGAGKSSIDLNA